MCKEMGLNLACVVCPPDFRGLHKSPMRRCGPEKWVHLQCKLHLGVLFVPEVELDSDDFHIPVKGVDDIDAAAMTIKCTLCGKRVRGLTVHCAEATCSESFHIQCAVERGYHIVDKHKLVCHEHFGNTPAPRAAPLPAYMIRTPQSLHSEKRSTSNLQVRPAPRPRENRVEPEHYSPLVLQRSTPETNCFSVVEDYFSEMQYQWLDTSPAPTGRETNPALYSPLTQGLQRVLLTSKLATALVSFRTQEVTEEQSSQIKPLERDNVLIEPFLAANGQIGPAVLLDCWKKLSPQEGEDIELLGKCLEACSGPDEVTKESQFALELLSRSVLPTANVLKQTLRRISETAVPRLRLNELKDSQYQLNVATRWGFIYRNFKNGLKDKTQEAYQKHIHVLEQGEKSVEVNYCDCCICYNMDEDEYILNPIEVCVGCRLYMHRDCYGVKDASGEFVCQKCRDMGSPRCCLCGKGGSAIKKDGDKFFHPFCALVDSRVDFKDRLYLNTLKMPLRSSGICMICARNDGLLTQCELCESSFHYFCAWHQGWLFLTSEAQDSNIRTVSAVRRIQVTVRCSRHNSDGRDPVLQQILRLKPYTYAIDRDKIEDLARPVKRLKRRAETETESKPNKLPKTITAHTVACEERSNAR